MGPKHKCCEYGLRSLPTPHYGGLLSKLTRKSKIKIQESNDERARLLSQALYSIGPEQFPFKDTRYFPFYLENREQTKTASRANDIKLF